MTGKQQHEIKVKDHILRKIKQAWKGHESKMKVQPMENERKMKGTGAGAAFYALGSMPLNQNVMNFIDNERMKKMKSSNGCKCRENDKVSAGAAF